jgi:hypothetical protein
MAYTWQQVRANGTSGLAHRDSARTFWWRGRQWISNGYQYGGAAVRDLMASNNGSDWFTVNASTPYPAYSPIAPHGDKLFIVGTDKVRTTVDGVNYTTVLDPTPFSGLFAEAPFIGNFVAAGETVPKMYLFLAGGIHYSVDGTSWSTATPPWPSTYLNCAGIVYNGKVYIMGGDITQANTPVEAGDNAKTSLNVVWSSDKPEDPTSWVETQAPWNPRMWPSLAVLDGEVWMTGGYSNTQQLNYADTWRFDGTNWRKAWVTADFTSRHAATMFPMNGFIFMVAGNRNPDVTSTMSDVWVLKQN